MSFRATATMDLTELFENHKILKRTGDIGAGTNYILIGSNNKNELHINCTYCTTTADSQRIWWHICIFANAQTNAKKIQKSHQPNTQRQT